MKMIYADALQKHIANNVPLKYFMGRDVGKADQNMLHIINEIESMPTVDAVPVVRCKDCVFGKLSELDHVGYECKFYEEQSFYKLPDDFCSDGKHR